MFIETDRGRIEFCFDEGVGHWASIFDLSLWSRFQSKYIRPALNGSKVLLILQDAHEHEDLKYSWEHLPCYVYCLSWFLQNEARVQESALFAINALIDELKLQYKQWGGEEPAGCLNNTLSQMIALSYIRFYPESKDDLPYFGLEFECDWDLEHGCGLMFHGINVIIAGKAEVTNSYIDFEEHGAYVDL
jgi:hypothetical protein